MRPQYLGVFALVAGGVPLFLLGRGLFARQHILTIPDLGMFAAVILFPLVAAIVWHRGDKRMVAGGCLLWIIPALVSLTILTLAISFAAR